MYNDLCIWKASHAKPPAGANEERAATVETKHTTLTGSLEPEQDRDTPEQQLPLPDLKYMMCHIEEH